MKRISIRNIRCALATGLILTASVSAMAATHYSVDSAEVVVHCPLTVGGSFQAKTSTLTGKLTSDTSESSLLTGELSVDLSTLDTGIGLRDRHLTENYLEVGEPGNEEALLTNIKLDPGPASQMGKTSFTATLRLHGTEQEVKGKAKLSKSGDAVEVEASFPVTLPDYGIAKPRHLGIGVKDKIRIDVTLKLSRVEAGTGEQS